MTYIVGGIVAAVAAVIAFIYTWGKSLMASEDHDFTPAVLTRTYPTPSVSPELPPTAPMDKIRLFALAHQSFEGYYPNTTAYVNKNPGNCKGADGKFLVFKTYEAGLAYLEDYIRRAATGKHPAYPKGGNTTIFEYACIYAPDGLAVNTNYANHLANAVSLSTQDKIALLLL